MRFAKVENITCHSTFSYIVRPVIIYTPYLEFSDLSNKGVKFCCYALSKVPQNAGHIPHLNAFSHYILSKLFWCSGSLKPLTVALSLIHLSVAKASFIQRKLIGPDIHTKTMKLECTQTQPVLIEKQTDNLNLHLTSSVRSSIRSNIPFTVVCYTSVFSAISSAYIRYRQLSTFCSKTNSGNTAI